MGSRRLRWGASSGTRGRASSRPSVRACGLVLLGYDRQMANLFDRLRAAFTPRPPDRPVVVRWEAYRDNPMVHGGREMRVSSTVVPSMAEAQRELRKVHAWAKAEGWVVTVTPAEGIAPGFLHDYLDVPVGLPMPATTPIGKQMEARFASGTAYTMRVLWDQRRHIALVDAITGLMALPDGDQTAASWRGLAGSSILDIGCGVGGTCAFVPPENQRQFVGVEISATACVQARKQYPTATFVESPAEWYEPAQSFDLVNCIEAIEHWPDEAVPGILATMRKAMRPDSRLVMSTPNADALHHRIGRKLGRRTPVCCDEHIHEYGFDELLGFMRNHGFEVVRSAGVFITPYWALEGEFGGRIRSLTDHDPEVNEWMAEIGAAMPPKYAFGQCHSFRLASP